MQMERHIACGIGWVAYVVLGGILCGFPAKAGQNAQKPFVKVNLVELDSSALGGAAGEAEVLRLFRSGKGRIAFSCVLTPGGKRRYADTRWQLVPMGFQCEKTRSGMPNPMNFARRGLGTCVSVQDLDVRPARFTLEREYITGLEAARSATPETFVEPVSRTLRFDFEVPSVNGDSVVGGGWHEDGTDKVYYVVVSGAGHD